MDYLLFGLVIFICVYSTKKRPAITLAYLCFFQILNKLLFYEIGFTDYRYVTTILFLPLIYFFHRRKMKSSLIISNFIKNKITWGYLLLVMYMVYYAVYIASQYEIDFIKSFLFPGIILFVIASVFFYYEEMYKNLFYGIIIFSIITFVAIISLKAGGTKDYYIEREFVGEATSISTITQGRMAGLFAVFSLLMIQFKKGIGKYTGIAFIVLSLTWLGLTGTRGALVSLLLTMIFYLFLTKQKILSVRKLLIYSVFAIPILVYIGFVESPLIVRASELLELESIQGMKRYYRYILYWEYIKDNFIYGLGPAGWSKHIMIGGGRYAHNIIMEMTIEYGLVGAFSLLLIFIPCIIGSISIIRDNIFSIYLKSIALAWIYYATNAMFSGNIIGNINLFTLSGIMIGIELYRRKNNYLILQKST